LIEEGALPALLLLLPSQLLLLLPGSNGYISAWQMPCYHQTTVRLPILSRTQPCTSCSIKLNAANLLALQKPHFSCTSAQQLLGIKPSPVQQLITNPWGLYQQQ
jgi:hypothetical protein